MIDNTVSETMINQNVTYIFENAGGFLIIENVPARVCVEKGERFFTPEIVEKIQQIILGNQQPIKIIETPVYQFN